MGPPPAPQWPQSLIVAPLSNVQNVRIGSPSHFVHVPGVNPEQSTMQNCNKSKKKNVSSPKSLMAKHDANPTGGEVAQIPSAPAVEKHAWPPVDGVQKLQDVPPWSFARVNWVHGAPAVVGEEVGEDVGEAVGEADGGALGDCVGLAVPDPNASHVTSATPSATEKPFMNSPGGHCRLTSATSPSAPGGP